MAGGEEEEEEEEEDDCTAGTVRYPDEFRSTIHIFMALRRYFKPSDESFRHLV